MALNLKSNYVQLELIIKLYFSRDVKDAPITIDSCTDTIVFLQGRGSTFIGLWEFYE